MTIHDLDWSPARYGQGFIATLRFDNGKVAHVRCTPTEGGGESYSLMVFGKDQRVNYSAKDLDQTALTARLNTIPYRA